MAGWLAGWMDRWMGEKFHTYTRTGQYPARLLRPMCRFSHFHAATSYTIDINRAGFDVQALIPGDSLPALSHNNLDDWETDRTRPGVCVSTPACLSLRSSMQMIVFV